MHTAEPHLCGKPGFGIDVLSLMHKRHIFFKWENENAQGHFLKLNVLTLYSLFRLWVANSHAYVGQGGDKSQGNGLAIIQYRLVGTVANERIHALATKGCCSSQKLLPSVNADPVLPDLLTSEKTEIWIFYMCTIPKFKCLQQTLNFTHFKTFKTSCGVKRDTSVGQI